jgi:long-subunit fatty acid transport protein
VWFAWPPIKLRAGVRFAWPRADLVDPDAKGPVPAHLKEWFDIELAFFWENSDLLDYMYMQISGQVPYGRESGQASEFNVENDGVFSIQRGWKDCWSIRLGGDVNLWKGRISISLGGFFDRGAAPPAYSRLDYITWDRWGLTGGIAVRLWKLELRLAYAHFFYPTREVTNGAVQHIQGFGDEGNVINNGTYDASIDILTAGILARF